MTIASFAATLLLATTLFVATNIDDLFILVGFFADRKFRAREVFAGQYLGIIALAAVSLFAALAAVVIPPEHVGLLGLAPIALGVKQWLDVWRGSDEHDDEHAHHGGRSGAGRILAVAIVTVANGGDNLGVYIPTFAVRPLGENLVICALFILMTAAWCLFAHWLVSHPTLGSPIRRYSHRVMPFVLIGLGLLILYEAGTIELLR